MFLTLCLKIAVHNNLKEIAVDLDPSPPIPSTQSIGVYAQMYC